MAPPAVTGEIRSTRRLQETRAHLLIRAYNALHPEDHATATLNITVQGTDRQAPRCVPAIFVYGSGRSGGRGTLCCPQVMGQRLSCWLPCHRSQVSETVPPGSTLETLRCTDSTSTDRGLHYALEGPPSSLSHFCMEGPQLKVSGAMGSAQVDSQPRPRSPGGQVGPCDTCCHASFWGRASCSPRPAHSPCLLPPSPLALQLCGTPWLLWDTLALQGI